MPELPEVETIAARLRLGSGDAPPLLGKTITRARLLWERTLVTPGAEEFLARITNQRFREVGRRGKFLIFTLSPDSLLLHLRMSGDIWLEPQTTEVAKHHRLLLELDDGWRLAFNDARKFGRLWLVADPATVLKDLGPEPLDAGFRPNEFYRRLHASRRQLKPLLLDQSFLAGLGNIYTDEALHMAGLHPCTLSDATSLAQAQKLWHSIQEVVREGIRRNGASIDWVYRGGDFQNHFRVYQRTGQPCPVCGTPIQRKVVGQRGTHICPLCQPEPGEG